MGDNPDIRGVYIRPINTTKSFNLTERIKLIIMPKGKYIRRRKSLFTKGHHLSPSCRSERPAVTQTTDSTPRKICRLSQTMQYNIENSPVGPPVSMDQPDMPMFLRPSKDAEELSAIECTEDESYRILSHHKVLELFNKALSDHKDCPGNLSWDRHAEKKWGLCWIMGLKCMTCSFRTGSHKLYYEIPRQRRGRKSASANVGIQVGLTQSMISNSSLRHILMSTNIKPPSEQGMQRQANNIGDRLVELNQQDMHDQRLAVKAVQNLRGQTVLSLQKVMAATTTRCGLVLEKRRISLQHK